MKLRVTTVGRKPLSEGNVAENILKWRTSALNIGASRIGDEIVKTNHTKFTPHPDGGWAGNVGTGEQSFHEGRWPANMVLRGEPGGEHHNEFGDSENYFLHVNEADMAKIPQELIDYLHTMITPEGGTTIVSLDINEIDWSQYKDQDVHGLIAMGDPKPHLEEIWRVLRPGAHIMLIAPDEEPTGHTGACALEDKGFEIRDAILLVQEAGRIHYVPKSSTAERNAGVTPFKETKMVTRAFAKEDADLDDDVFEKEQIKAAFSEEGLPPEDVPEDWLDQFDLQEVEITITHQNNHPCLHPDDLVMTAKGYRPLTEIQVGDSVYAQDGKFHLVEHVSRHPYTSPNLFEVKVLGTNYTTKASDNHPFLIWRPVRKNNAVLGGDVQWVEGKDVRRGDYTMTPLMTEPPSTAWPEDAEFWTMFGLPIEHEGQKYLVRYVKEVVEVPYQGDVMNLSVEGSPTFLTPVGMTHNTVKPKDIMKRLMHDIPEDATVLDPFMGSGSTGIACLETGRNFIGIEREEPYIKIADARLRHWDTAKRRQWTAEIDSEAPQEEGPDDPFGGMFG